LAGEVMATRRAFIGGGAAAIGFMASVPVYSQPSDPTDLTIAEASRLIRAGALSPVELTRAYLARIDRLEPRINAFITVSAELALEQARSLEAELTEGRWRGPLHGIPIALKDNIDTAGLL